MKFDQDLCGTCDMNSTLGSVVPLAMFYDFISSKSSSGSILQATSSLKASLSSFASITSTVVFNRVGGLEKFIIRNKGRTKNLRSCYWMVGPKRGNGLNLSLFQALRAKNCIGYLDLEKHTYVRQNVTRAVKKITAPRPIWTC